MSKPDSREIGIQVADDHRRLFNLQIQEKFGVNPGMDEPYLPLLLVRFSDEYQAMITRLDERTRLKIEALNQQKAASTAREVQERADGEQKRLDTIARRIFKGQLTQVRQQNFGVQYYIWRTQEDDRVRDIHVANDGKIFRWDTLPPNGHHPGQAINCRCWAEPMMGPDGRSTFVESAHQTLISEIHDNPDKWGIAKLLYHFYFGEGLPVTLAEMGRLSEVIDYYFYHIVRGGHNTYDRINSQITSAARNQDDGSLYYDFRDSYAEFKDYYWPFGGGTVKGVFNGSLRKEKSVMYIEGVIDYRYSDTFTDPTSIDTYL